MAPSWYAQNDSSREAVILGVLLPQRAGRRVAGIGEGLEPRLELALVELLERRHRHVHLAAHLEHRRHRAPLLRPPQRVGHGGDGGHVGGDVVAGDPVAAGGRLHQPAVLVDERHGEPVDLELADEGGLDRLGCDAGHAVEPGVQLLDAEGVVEAHHRRPVLHRGEQHRRCPPTRRVGESAVTSSGWASSSTAAPDQGVVVGVADLGGVELVVAVVVVRDQAAELLARVPRRHLPRSGCRACAGAYRAAYAAEAATAAPTTASGSRAS